MLFCLTISKNKKTNIFKKDNKIELFQYNKDNLTG